MHLARVASVAAIAMDEALRHAFSARFPPATFVDLAFWGEGTRHVRGASFGGAGLRVSFDGSKDPYAREGE